MARLINYYELKQRILEERDKIPKTLPGAIYEFGIEKPNHHGNSMRGGIRKALRCLEQCQTVTDAVEVVHAKWVLVGDGMGVCSNCHRLDYIDVLATHCRYCGARLEVGKEDGK